MYEGDNKNNILALETEGRSVTIGRDKPVPCLLWKHYLYYDSVKMTSPDTVPIMLQLIQYKL